MRTGKTATNLKELPQSTQRRCALHRGKTKTNYCLFYVFFLYSVDEEEPKQRFAV